jgi:mercuric ion binding protein
MKRITLTATAVAALGGAGIIFAVVIPPLAAQSVAAQVSAVQTVVFAIKNMTFELCPVTVKTAMTGVKGVQSVQIDFDAKTATVVFDPSVTTVDAIAAASTNAGYPAAPAG